LDPPEVAGLPVLDGVDAAVDAVHDRVALVVAEGVGAGDKGLALGGEGDLDGVADAATEGLDVAAVGPAAEQERAVALADHGAAGPAHLVGVAAAGPVEPAVGTQERPVQVVGPLGEG